MLWSVLGKVWKKCRPSTSNSAFPPLARSSGPLGTTAPRSANSTSPTAQPRAAATSTLPARFERSSTRVRASGVQEGERGLVDHHQLAAQRQLAQLVLRQGAGEADAADAVRQLAQHDRQHGAELRRVGVVQIVERQDRARLQMLEIGTEEHAGEFARPLRIFRAEHRHRLRHLLRAERAREIVIEAGDVLVALVDPVPDIGRLGAVQVVDDRGGLAIAGRGRKPADAGTQRIIDQIMDARPLRNAHLARRRELRDETSSHGSSPHDSGDASNGRLFSRVAVSLAISMTCDQGNSYYFSDTYTRVCH